VARQRIPRLGAFKYSTEKLSIWRKRRNAISYGPPERRPPHLSGRAARGRGGRNDGRGSRERMKTLAWQVP
jgi:hypothetical protein